MPIPFQNTYVDLPARFYSKQLPTPVSAPKIVAVNTALAADLGIDPADLTADVLAGNAIPDGADPIALVYAGHQFGGWNPQLGDGRAVLLGEVVGKDGRRDIQLKGSGPTMFSRNGDGRAVIGAVLREYLVSEAMFALGVPTTRALAAVTTGDQVLREGYQPGAILTRVAQSHIRVGTFQYFYSRKDVDGLQSLADYVIARHYPDAAKADNPVIAMLAAIVERQAKLVAKWMTFGFIHGVMNTDNMAVSGETIDYGPCAFMDVFDHATVFSSIDRQARYAWNNQPKIAHWNLSQLAQSLMPILDGDEDAVVAQLQTALDPFGDIFTAAYFDGFGAKLGISTVKVDDHVLINDLLDLMAVNSIDFTLFFRHLTHDLTAARAMFTDQKSYDGWFGRWQTRTTSDSAALMATANPVFIPRNHRIEEAIEAANIGNYTPFEKLHAVLANPYTLQPDNAELEAAPTDAEIVHATFCGT